MQLCTILNIFSSLASIALTSPVSFNIAEAQNENGLIVGHAAQDRPEVIEWLGIPYGEAARFASPRRKVIKGTFKASNFSPECPSIHGNWGTLPGQQYTKTEPRIMGYFLEKFKVSMSDDCLALNVWSKRCGCQKPKPVLFWAYGGHWETGQTNTPFYDGQYLAAKEDIVIVTYNYRFGIFGFGKDNVGLEDSRLALEWVRDNIAAYGGDPSRITFAGHSAGAFVADILAFAKPDNPVASAYILQSGTATTLPPTTPELRDQGFRNVSVAMGCSNMTNADILDCLRSKDLHELAIAALHTHSPDQLMSVFGPTVDNQTVFTTAEYLRRGSAGNFAKIPTLLGNTDYEQGFYKLQYSAQQIYLNESTWAAFGQRLATCPTAQGAKWRFKQAPTWRYRYFGQYPSLELYGPNASNTSYGSGAYHGSELSLVWGTSEVLTQEVNTPEQARMSEYLMSAWGAFVRDPEHGLEKLDWPRYDPSGFGLIRLAEPGSAQMVSVGNSTEFDFIRGVGCEYVMQQN